MSKRVGDEVQECRGSDLQAITSLLAFTLSEIGSHTRVVSSEVALKN
jgi:hypothetical protein